MVRMPPALYERLSEAAEKTMMTPSAMARILLKQQLDVWDEEAENAEMRRRSGVVQGRVNPLPRAERRRREREEEKRRKKSEK